MPSPNKQWYTIKEIEGLLLLSPEDVIYFLETGIIKVSVLVRNVSETISTASNDPFNTADPDRITVRIKNGLFVIDKYSDINWVISDKGSEYDSFELSGLDGSLYDINSLDKIVLKFYPSDRVVRRNELLITDNDLIKLKTELVAGQELKHNEAIPYLDPKHKYFSEELAVAVKTWVNLYGTTGKYSSKRGHKEQIKALLLGKGLTNAAIERISTLINPNKEGGAPSTEK